MGSINTCIGRSSHGWPWIGIAIAAWCISCLLGMVLGLIGWLIAWLIARRILRLELGLTLRRRLELRLRLRRKRVLGIGLMLVRIARRPLRLVSSKGVVTGSSPRRAGCLLRGPSCR
ncbi:hypothetical protein CCR96_13535 [Halochromatium roseum]|nr:hypothetical protein [Halochromatium roseum]